MDTQPDYCLMCIIKGQEERSNRKLRSASPLENHATFACILLGINSAASWSHDVTLSQRTKPRDLSTTIHAYLDTTILPLF